MDKKTTKILLVSTGYSPANEIDSGQAQLQLGQLYLATILKEKGYFVKLYSHLFPDPDEFINLIAEENFSIVGFYSTTNTIQRVRAMVELVKKNFPSLLVFLGGPHPTVMDRETLLETKADLIMRHEAEYTFQEVMDYFCENKGTLDAIKGITYRKGADIIRTPSRDFIKNLDEIPIPDWHLLEGDLAEINRKFPSIITGRGCPFNCTFCFEGFSGNTYRLRSAENVIKELDMLLDNWSVKYIKFVDDTFVVNSERVEKICNYLRRKRKKHNFYWFCEARVDILNKRLTLLEKMRAAGLVVIQIGVESGNQHVLDLYNKKITLEQIENVVRASVEADIFSIAINVILGGPFENLETIAKTTEFIKKLIKIGPGRVFCQSSLLTPYPKTPITENPEKFGLVNIDPCLCGGQTEETCFMESEKMNCYDLYRARMKFEHEIYHTMLEEAENITSKQIEQNIHLTEYGIKTPWHTIITLDEGMKRYFNLKIHSLYKGIEEIKPDELGEWCPVRTFPLEYSDNRILIKKAARTIKLMPKETVIYEISSRKLSFDEILMFLCEKTGKNPDELRKEMIEFYKKMDRIYGVIFSRI